MSKHATRVKEKGQWTQWIDWWPVICTVIAWAILFAYLVDGYALKPIHGAWYSIDYGWADIHYHLGLITNFAQRGFSAITNDPFYHGQALQYPLVLDLITSLFVRLGVSLRWSLIITTYPLFVALTVALCATGYLITRDKRAAALVPWLYYLYGGAYAWVKVGHALSSGSSVWHIFTSPLANLLRGPEDGVYLTNPISDFLFPQRTILLGLLVGLVIMGLLVGKGPQLPNVKRSLAIGLLLACLPIIHTHTLIAMGVVVAVFAIRDLFHHPWRSTVRAWLPALVTSLALAVPQILLLTPSGSFLRIDIGWVAASPWEWVMIWIKSLGIYLLLLPLAWRYGGQHRKPLLISAVILFVLVNLITFQSYDWDNTKLLQWMLVLAIVPVSSMLVGFMKATKHRILRHATTYALLGTLLLPGLSVYAYGLHAQSRVFDTDDIALAAYVQSHAEKDALFLTSKRYDNPIVSLAGRQVLSGHGLWLWSHGIDPKAREADVVAMYEGRSTAQLITRYGIEYILVDHDNPDHLNFDLQAIANISRPEYENAKYSLYTVSLRK